MYCTTFMQNFLNQFLLAILSIVVFNWSWLGLPLKISILYVYVFLLQVTELHGHGKILNPNEVAVLGPDGTVTDTIKTKNIVIATGSEVTPFPGIEVR